MEYSGLLVLIAVAIIWYGCIKSVPQQEIWIVERFGKFHKKMEAGLNFILPFIDVVAYKHSLKENAVDIPQQTAITSDNVTLIIDGIIYVKVVDPVAASYGVENPLYAISQLAQTAMRSEIGKIVLDRTFEERDTLNTNIVHIINEAAINWGLQCMRYEIKDITPPENVRDAMELQVAAERKKRALILASEGDKQAKINNAEGEKAESILASEANKLAKINEAEGRKQASILESEAKMIELVNNAKGEQNAILLVAEATATALTQIAKAMENESGRDAAVLKIAESYIQAFEKLAKQSTTMIIPSEAGNVNSMVAQACSIMERFRGSK